MSKDRKWHFSPQSGVRRCYADRRDCPFGHYASEKEANRAYGDYLARKAAMPTSDDFRKELNSEDPRITYLVTTDLLNRSDYMREIESDLAEHSPKNLTAVLAADFQDGTREYSFIARRGYQIVGAVPRIKPYWNLMVVDYCGSESKVVEEKAYPLDTKLDAKDLKRDAYRMVTNTAAKTYSSQSEAEEIRDEVIDSFVNSVSSIESRNRGAFFADSIGFSFFSESDKDTLRAKADFSETSFSSRDFKSALSSDVYKYHLPDSEITIQDSKAKTSDAYWTLKSKNDRWTLYVTHSDNRIEAFPSTENAQDIKTHLGSLEPEMDYSQEEMDRVLSGVDEIIEGSRRAREDHQNQVSFNLQELERSRMPSERPRSKKKILGIF